MPGEYTEVITNVWIVYVWGFSDSMKEYVKDAISKIEDTVQSRALINEVVELRNEWIDFVNINEEWLSEIFIIISKKVWIIE